MGMGAGMEGALLERSLLQGLESLAGELDRVVGRVEVGDPVQVLLVAAAAALNATLCICNDSLPFRRPSVWERAGS
jgi:hypothetical protein